MVTCKLDEEVLPNRTNRDVTTTEGRSGADIRSNQNVIGENGNSLYEITPQN